MNFQFDAHISDKVTAEKLHTKQELALTEKYETAANICLHIHMRYPVLASIPSSIYALTPRYKASVTKPRVQCSCVR